MVSMILTASLVDFDPYKVVYLAIVYDSKCWCPAKYGGGGKHGGVLFFGRGQPNNTILKIGINYALY